MHCRFIFCSGNLTIFCSSNWLLYQYAITCYEAVVLGAAAIGSSGAWHFWFTQVAEMGMKFLKKRFH